MVIDAARLVIAAPTSGQGKTTVATGLMAALSARGHEVAPFKVGPDYIDPGYHSLACGRPGRNLDPVLCGESLIAPLFAHGSQACEVAIVEGVMGLFDGRLGTHGFGSTAHVASLLSAPVVVVIDVARTSRSAAAIIAGLAAFDPEVQVAGIVFNRVGSPRHERELRDAVASLGLPVLGCLPRNLKLEAPSRHLGLVPAAERDDSGVQAMGEIIAEHLDLAGVLDLARSAPPLATSSWDPRAVVAPPTFAQPASRPRVAIAGGRAFTFRYPETDELLEAAGLEVVVFDPLNDPHLPADVSGLWLGGGFPEVHAKDLAANISLLGDIADQIASGLPTVAECAGLLYLCQRLDDLPMVGAIEAEAAMTPRLTMGYREALSPVSSLLGRPGEIITGHEFHRTGVTEPTGSAAWLLDGRPDGVATNHLHASYLHTHWAGHPQLAQRFSDAVHRRAGQQPLTHDSSSSAGQGQVEAGPELPAASLINQVPPSVEPDLSHHGDQDLGAGLLDFAVNLRSPAPPDWLTAELIRDLDWASYPDAEPARAAIAAHHGLDPAMVLPLAGAAEGFTLIARAISGSSVVIHPQFTEPEAALRAAGRDPHRHLLSPDDGFTLRAGGTPSADLIFVGNPTNPTGVLHSAESLLALPAGVLVTDEAFLDAVPGQAETLISAQMPRRLVLRSLTKTWALAGIRAGYVVGDPELIARLAAQQTPWSVSTPAIRATVACLQAERSREAADLAEEAQGQRADLVARLSGLGLSPIPGLAPFVLFNTACWAPHSLRSALAERGIAVRRGESFPGLGPTWLRVAVRGNTEHQLLVEALAEIKESL